jgi:hypothetical protein
MNTLRWEQQPTGSWFGYSAELMVAMVVKISSNGDAEGWHWRVDGARNPDGWVNSGHRKTAESARLAAVRYWKRWLKHAGLTLASRPTKSAEIFKKSA